MQMKSLGAFLRSNRKRLGLTQDAIAEKLNIVTPVLSKWENDKSVPDLTALCKLCNIYGLSISDCINLENSENPILPPKEYNAVILGNTIKELRQRNDWTQSEVGNKLFVTSQTVSKWEAGGVTSLELLQKLSTLYAVPPEVLLFGFDSATTPTSAPQEAPVTKAANKRKIIISVVAILLSLFIVVCAVLTAILVKRCSAKEDNDSFVLPVHYYEFYSDYGEYKEYKNHTHTLCIHFFTSAGSEVYSVAAGTVKDVYLDCINDLCSVIIEHGRGVVTIYKGITGVTLSKGDKVKAGQAIALVDIGVGLESDDSQLCFAMEIDNTPVDPNAYLPMENN